MSLEEEIAIYQFAQGVHSDSVLLDSFRQLDEEERFGRFFDLFRLAGEFKVIPSDVDQAIAEGSFDPSYTPCVGVKPSWPKFRACRIPEGDLTQDFRFMLYLVKTTYQRRFELDKGDATTGWYQDLSDSEVVKGIATRYEALVEELYHSPGYRSEFTCLAKLQHEHELSRQTEQQKDNSVEARKYHFVTYDEMINESVTQIGGLSRYLYPIEILRHSLEKGLAKNYRLTPSHGSRVVSDVIARYFRDMYHTDL